MNWLETILKSTAFVAIIVIASLAGFTLHMFLGSSSVAAPTAESITASKEIIILAITSIGSLATGGAVGYMAGRMSSGNDNKDN